APAAEPAGVPSTSDRPRMEPARLDDGSKVTLPPMAIAPASPEADRRPVYVGAGVLALAALFYWNRRKRDRFGAESGGEPRPRRRRAARGADDDDLHAAAEASEDGDPHER
nr:DUF4448 domain-containing protein [Myxococcota bacterium]